MHGSEREPQIVYEAEDYVVVRGLPFECPAVNTRDNGPRGVRSNDTVWPARWGLTTG